MATLYHQAWIDTPPAELHAIATESGIASRYDFARGHALEHPNHTCGSR